MNRYPLLHCINRQTLTNTMYRQISNPLLKLISSNSSLVRCVLERSRAHACSRRFCIQTVPHRVIFNVPVRSKHTRPEPKVLGRTTKKRKTMLEMKRNSKPKPAPTLESLVVPVPVEPHVSKNSTDIGAELAGVLKREEVVSVFRLLSVDKSCMEVAAEKGITGDLYRKAMLDFKRFCVESIELPVEMHIILKDIANGAGHVSDMLPFFMEHAIAMYPHLRCLEDLKKISDLSSPVHWYPAARAVKRRIIYHSGPTNSGKTYQALQKFFRAESGVYCGPLRLLANEIFHRSNREGTPCDLVTGEERICVDPDGNPACHVSCTVEMTSLDTPYEVAVIDEIQMLRDENRGWAWTRALLGINAEEVHVCGEGTAEEFIREIAESVGDTFEMNTYERLTPLEVMDEPLGDLKYVQPGDAVVCFTKADIYKVSQKLETIGIESAVIYGSLPSGTKVSQANNFNNPNHPAKVLVATDAIGMGLNLSIQRIVFYSLNKPSVDGEGNFTKSSIKPHEALQIAGRAGRFGKTKKTGLVTTLFGEDLPKLKKLMATSIQKIEKVGLQPAVNQIELFAYHLPQSTLSNLIDIFMTLCSLDHSRYFMCRMDSFKTLADVIEGVPLDLTVRYTFCCSPISTTKPFVIAAMLMMARRFSKGSPLTEKFLTSVIEWPLKSPKTLADLVHLEDVFDVLDLYLWLGYRFPDMFVHMEETRAMQGVLELKIQEAVQEIVRLLLNETRRAQGNPLIPGKKLREKVPEMSIKETLLKDGVLRKLMKTNNKKHRR
ncbi:hypothetical protein CAPTEDRAFT_184427 [Capitella teleta]|uniref:RNA helicase n=1 Tax=Capitella teleta TaxID=283909 RepID=R7UPI5_CAPTE|nr:hypothetical protein CAPTEDRAFT_184427 [Capitella teleta]|eukprot:ELU08439.1 hypothetical protein CAPTEDRAFT_184427 [Capitella teleta]